MIAPQVRRYVDLALIAIAVVFWIAAFQRAKEASFIHDESYTYLYYPRLPLKTLLLHEEPFTNNHLLNSVGMKFSEMFFGTSELSLRLPNLLALLIFLIYGVLLLRNIPWPLSISGFLLICSNEYVMELFTVARGYGLATGFMMMGVYHLIRSARCLSARDLVLFHIALILAVLSNFAMLGTYIAMLITFHVLNFSVHHRILPPRRMNLTNVFMTFAAFGILFIPIHQVLQESDLQFGGTPDLYSATVNTLVLSEFPGVRWVEDNIIYFHGLFTIITVAAVFMVCKALIRNEPRPLLIGATLTFILTIIGALLQHELFGVDHLEGRFAMFLMPMFWLMFIFLMASFRQRTSKVVMVLMPVLALSSAYAFARKFGPDQSIEWRYDLNTKDAMQMIKEDLRSHDPEQKLYISGQWLFEPTVNFYRIIWGLDALLPMGRFVEFSDRDDYRYDFLGAEHQGYVRIGEFHPSGTQLLKRREE